MSSSGTAKSGRGMVIRGRGRKKFCVRLRAHLFYIHLIHTELPHFAKSSDGPAMDLRCINLESTIVR